MSFYDEKVTWGGAAKVILGVAVFAVALYGVGHTLLAWAMRHGIIP